MLSIYDACISNPQILQ